MAHSFTQLKANLMKLWNRFNPYLFHFVFWFGFPCIIFLGKYISISAKKLALLCPEFVQSIFDLSNYDLTNVFDFRPINAWKTSIFADGDRFCDGGRVEQKDANDGRTSRYDVK